MSDVISVNCVAKSQLGGAKFQWNSCIVYTRKITKWFSDMVIAVVDKVPQKPIFSFVLGWLNQQHRHYFGRRLERGGLNFGKLNPIPWVRD